MFSCPNCENKSELCYCPPNMECTQYKPKTPKKVTRVFLFETSKGWKPSAPACWTECPFSLMLKWGETCKFIQDTNSPCPLKKSKEVDIK